MAQAVIRENPAANDGLYCCRRAIYACDEGRHAHVISECAEATTMSMLGPVTCSALTVIAPVFPLGELVCSLTMTLMPPGSEREWVDLFKIQPYFLLVTLGGIASF